MERKEKKNAKIHFWLVSKRTPACASNARQRKELEAKRERNRDEEVITVQDIVASVAHHKITFLRPQQYYYYHHEHKMLGAPLDPLGIETALVYVDGYQDDACHDYGCRCRSCWEEFLPSRFLLQL